MYTFKTYADRTFIISSKGNVHRNMEEIGEHLPLKRLCTAKHRMPSNRTYKLQRIWYRKSPKFGHILNFDPILLPEINFFETCFTVSKSHMALSTSG